MQRLMIKLVVSCLMVASAATGVMAGEALKLEYRFRDGDVNRYRVKEKVTCDHKIGPFSPNSDWDAVLVLRVAKVLENGDGEIAASYESGTMRMQGQAADDTRGFCAEWGW